MREDWGRTLGRARCAPRSRSGQPIASHPSRQPRLAVAVTAVTAWVSLRERGVERAKFSEVA
jgi:hypothetical protein